MSTSVLLNGTTGSLPSWRSSIASGGTGVPARSPKLLALLLEQVPQEEHDPKPNRDPAGGDGVAQLGQPEGLPAQRVLGEVEPERGDHGEKDERGEGDGHRRHHRSGPGPFPSSKELVSPLHQGGEAPFESLRDRQLHSVESSMRPGGVILAALRERLHAGTGAPLVKPFTRIPDTIRRTAGVRNSGGAAPARGPPWCHPVRGAARTLGGRPAGAERRSVPWSRTSPPVSRSGGRPGSPSRRAWSPSPRPASSRSSPDTWPSSRAGSGRTAAPSSRSCCSSWGSRPCSPCSACPPRPSAS